MSNYFKKDQLRELIIAHTKEIIRLPEVLFWGIIFPILLTIGLGLAFTQQGETIHRVAIAEGRTPQKILNFLDQHAVKTTMDDEEVYKLKLENEESGNTVFLFQREDWEDAIVHLKRGEISIILTDSAGNIKYNFDPVNAEAQLIYLKLINLLDNPAPVIAERENIEPLTLKGTRYIDFLVPGLIAMGIMFSQVWGISYNIIDKRAKKLLRRMIATPMKKSHYLTALIIVRSTMNFIEALLLFLFAWLFFDVIIQGSILALALLFIASNVAFGGIAILIASRTYSVEAGNGIINAVTTPMLILSGIFFSYQNFPDWAIGFIKILPLTILADSLRSIFIEGAGLEEIALPFFILFAGGSILFFLGLKIFRWH